MKTNNMPQLTIQLPQSKVKWLCFLLLSIVAAMSLFSVMQRLIWPTDIEVNTSDSAQTLSYVRVIPKERVHKKTRHLPEMKKSQEPPPERPTLSPFKIEAPTPVPVTMPSLTSSLSLNLYVGLGAQLLGAVDGNVIPLVKIAPMYPRQARAQGIEGWVNVGITISKTGTVLDVKILGSEPRRVFERAAIRSVYRWKFKPEIIEGAAIENYSTQMIHFTLGNP